MIYKNYCELAHLVRENISILPSAIDLVVGVPRSGCVPASMIAAYLNISYCSLSELSSGIENTHGITRAPTGVHIVNPQQRNHILIVDDSTQSGNTIKATKSKIESLQLKCDITYLCVYSTNKTKRLVDISFEILDGHRIFEWNALHRPEVSNYAFDLDGVLCVDPSSQQNDDGPNYLDFIVSAKPKFLPTYEIGCIVTSRLEKYRDQTEEWLRKNNVVYGALYMLDLLNAETRRKLGVHASFKAEVYQELENFLFVESDASQAYDIAKISGKFALCLNNQELYGPGLTKQRAMQRSRSLLRRIRQKLYLS